MIVRMWRGRTKAEALEEYADEYAAYVRKTGFVGLRADPHNLGAVVLAREVGDEAEFLVLSLWSSMEDIESFAGEDVDRAVYYPEDDRYLLEMEPGVRHYRVTDLEVE
jgi:heme-degrading monooxygenase HmoA